MIQGLTSKGLLGFIVCAGLVLCAVSPSAQAQVVYPLKVSANQRYLVDQNERPFMIVGDSPQGMITNLSISDAAEYFANRRSYGFNAVQIHLLGQDFFGRNDYSTIDGITPFTTPFDISTPRASYFDRVDAILNLAAQNDIVVFLTAAETIDSLDLFRANGVEKARAFGQYLGSRYRNYDNIVWVYGNDFQTWRDPNDNAVILAVAYGIKDMDSRHLHTVWLDYFVSASRDSAEWAAVSDIDFVYTYWPTYAKSLEEYALFPPKPVFLGEANYEGESLQVPLTTPALVRRQEYWSMTSGGTGSFYGHADIWHFRPGWQISYNSPGAAQMVHYKNFFESRAWWNLVPDSAHQVLTSGYGTYDRFGSVANNEYVTAAMASDASVMVAYLPTVRTVTVSMSKFADKVTAKWFDPSNGTYTTISGSPFNNAGNKHFTPPGINSDNNGDWVLVIETLGGGDNTPPSITGVTASNVTTSSATVNWTTNEPADTQVEYGLTPSYGQVTQLDSSLVTTHFASLAGLTANTTYHYRVRSRDGAGNLATSGDGVIVTSAAPDTTAPSISGVAVSNVTATSAVVSWTTNEPADSQVEYGLTTSYGATTTLNTSMVTAHAAPLAGLTANTTYHYRVRSKDAAGNLAVSSDGTFATGSMSGLSAQFLGESAEDRVGVNVTPNGIRDLRIRLQGLTGVPTKVRITGNPVGVWETPYNGLNWPIATQYAGDGTGNLWFDPLPGTNAFHVQVWYANGTTAEVDATAGSTPNPPGSFVAQFLGASAEDRVGMGVMPNGIPDLSIRLQGLTGIPTKVRITGNPVGVWETPYNGLNWPIATQYAGDGTGNLWFDPLPGTSVFRVQVWYADGTTAQVDATAPPGSLVAHFLGESSADHVGMGVTPNGIRDLSIRLQGLIGVPTKVRITGSPAGGWETPYNGLNWPIATQYPGDGTGILWFDPLPGTSQFHVQVWYADGSTAQAAVN